MFDAKRCASLTVPPGDVLQHAPSGRLSACHHGRLAGASRPAPRAVPLPLGQRTGGALPRRHAAAARAAQRGRWRGRELRKPADTRHGGTPGVCWRVAVLFALRCLCSGPIIAFLKSVSWHDRRVSKRIKTRISICCMSVAVQLYIHGCTPSVTRSQAAPHDSCESVLAGPGGLSGSAARRRWQREQEPAADARACGGDVRWSAAPASRGERCHLPHCFAAGFALP